MQPSHASGSLTGWQRRPAGLDSSQSCIQYALLRISPSTMGNWESQPPLANPLNAPVGGLSADFRDHSRARSGVQSHVTLFLGRGSGIIRFFRLYRPFFLRDSSGDCNDAYCTNYALLLDSHLEASNALGCCAQFRYLLKVGQQPNPTSD